MHSFVPTLVAAALATFACAVPVTRPPSNQVLSNIGNVDAVAGIHLRGFTSEVTDTVDSVESKLHLPDPSKVTNTFDAIGSTPHLRANVLSVSTIFAAIELGVQPYVQQLTHLTPSNATVAGISSPVSSIKASLEAAIAQLKALEGQKSSVVLAPVGSTGAASQDLSASEIADIVGADIKLIFDALGQVIAVVKLNSGSILTDVENLLEDLGNTVSELVTVVDGLVDGLAASLSPVLEPVEVIIAELGLDVLIELLGL